MPVAKPTAFEKFTAGISSGFVLTILLFFLSFAISYGELKIFDGNLVGIFDLQSLSINFYEVADKIFYFLQGLFFNAPFLIDLKQHKSGFIDIFLNFRKSGWKKLPIYLFLTLFWLLTASDIYDLTTRIWTFGMIVFAPLAKMAFDRRDKGSRESLFDSIFLVGFFITGSFVALVNFGSHISYEKIVKFNQNEGLTVKIENRDTKCIIIFASKDYKVFFTGSNFVVFDKDVGWIKNHL